MRKLIFTIILLVICTGLKAPPREPTNDFGIAKYQLSRTYLYHKSTSILEAVIWVESRGNSKAYNKRERAAGLLQLRPVMNREVNRILRKSKCKTRYSLKDRYDPVKSKEMFRIVMDYHNPSYNLRRCCIIWNGKGKRKGGSEKYYQLVVTQLNKQ
jgi:hypothetical protein